MIFQETGPGVLIDIVVLIGLLAAGAAIREWWLGPTKRKRPPGPL